MRSLVRKAGLVLLALVLLALLNETALRVALHLKNVRAYERFLVEKPYPSRRGQRVTFDAMVRPSKDPELIYELRPNMEVVHAGVRVRTNAEGWRDQDYPRARSPGTVRLLGLGDSNMFGWGVGQGQGYLEVLEQRLNRSFPGRRWEVINSAVPGYNAFIKVASLRWRALAFRPDGVIIQCSVNDMKLPTFVYDYPDPLDRGRSFVLDLLRGRYRLSEGGYRVVLEGEGRKVPDRYRHMEGERGLARALWDLKRMQQQAAFDVVVLISQDHPRGFAHAVQTISRELGFHPTVRLQRRDRAELIVGGKDLHPSALAHRLIAEHLQTFMQEQGLIERWMQMRR